MSSLLIPELPVDTARAAETAFGRDHLYVKIGRELAGVLADFELPASLVEDATLARLFWPLSLASILQYWEDLTDHQMVDASRTRLDMKYALHLPLNFPGFEGLALCQFRRHLRAGTKGKQALQEMIRRLGVFGVDPVKRRADANQIVDALCLLSRAEIVVESMGMALEAVATRCPDWLLSNALPHWFRRYYQKPGPQQIPRDIKKLEHLLQTIGKDAQHLLITIKKTRALNCWDLPEIQALQHVIADQFEQAGAELRWRSAGCASCVPCEKFVLT